jgi:hypothetical protein
MVVIRYNFLGQNLNNKPCILGLTKRYSNDLHINESNDAIKPSNSKLCVHSFIIKIIMQPIKLKSYSNYPKTLANKTLVGNLIITYIICFSISVLFNSFFLSLCLVPMK